MKPFPKFHRSLVGITPGRGKNGWPVTRFFLSLTFLFSCEFPPSPAHEEPPFQNVQWDAFPSDFLIASMEYDARQSEPFTI